MKKLKIKKVKTKLNLKKIKDQSRNLKNQNMMKIQKIKKSYKEKNAKL